MTPPASSRIPWRASLVPGGSRAADVYFQVQVFTVADGEMREIQGRQAGLSLRAVAAAAINARPDG